MSKAPAHYGESTGKFLRQFAHLDGEMKKRFLSAMRYLSESRHPKKCGMFKGRESIPGWNMIKAVYVYEINRSYRLMYTVHEGLVIFMRAGDHKAVYGHD